MANTVVPTVNSAAADASSGPAPVGSGSTNSAIPMVPAPEVLGGASTSGTISAASASSTAMPLDVAQQSPVGGGADTVNVGSPAAASPAPSFASDIGLAPQPITGWQANLWGPASNAAWSAALGASDSSADYSVAGNVPGIDSFIGDSSMGDTLWYYASAGDIEDSQIASNQSTTGADFGDQSQGAAGSVVTGNGADAAGWFTA